MSEIIYKSLSEVEFHPIEKLGNTAHIDGPFVSMKVQTDGDDLEHGSSGHTRTMIEIYCDSSDFEIIHDGNGVRMKFFGDCELNDLIAELRLASGALDDIRHRNGREGA